MKNAFRVGVTFGLFLSFTTTAWSAQWKAVTNPRDLRQAYTESGASEINDLIKKVPLSCNSPAGLVRVRLFCSNDAGENLSTLPQELATLAQLNAGSYSLLPKFEEEDLEQSPAAQKFIEAAAAIFDPFIETKSDRCELGMTGAIRNAKHYFKEYTLYGLFEHETPFWVFLSSDAKHPSYVLITTDQSGSVCATIVDRTK